MPKQDIIHSSTGLGDPLSLNIEDGNLRVMQVLPDLHSGGVERGALEIACYLQQKGITNFVCSSGGPLVKALDEAGIKHLKLPVRSKNPLTMLLNVYRLTRLIKKHGINLVHARSRAPAWSCLLACKLTGIAFVTTFHGAYSTGHPLKRFYNSVMLWSDKVIAISKYIAKHIETQYHFTSDDLVVIDRGVDLKSFNTDGITAERKQKVLDNIGREAQRLAGKKILLVPARFSRLKGHLYLIKALNYLQFKDYICIMIGKQDGGFSPYITEIENEIRNKNLVDKIILCTTPVTDMPALYSLADVVISPSLEPEGFGRTIIEAQAMGKIVLATSIGAPADIIVHGKTGFLAPASDAATFSEALESILHLDSKRTKKIIDAALNLARNQYNLDIMCAKTLETYIAARRSVDI
jgi:glycosyltransferase involved in cell wall biosynthesis